MYIWKLLLTHGQWSSTTGFDWKTFTFKVKFFVIFSSSFSSFRSVIYETFVLNNVNYFYNINVHSKWRIFIDLFYIKFHCLDIDHFHVSIGIFKINVVVDLAVVKMEHLLMIPISIAMIMMNRVAFVPMATSKISLYELFAF